MARAFAGALAVFGLTSVAACSSAALPPAAASPPRAPTFDSAFWAVWGDGQAELAGYALSRPRYGEQRAGTLVSIFVTEPFSKSDNVKAEKPRAASDVMQVLKHNLVEKFQTGLYDYQLFTSSFVTLESAPGRPVGSTTKVASSTQEWCGTTYHEVRFDERGGTEVLRSYFDGESRAGPLLSSAELAEDSAWHWARGLAAPVVAPGTSVDVRILPSLPRARLAHEPVVPRSGTLARASAFERITVPAGSFEVSRATVTMSGGPTTTFFVERAPPHRVVRMERSDGVTAELTGSMRAAYWKTHSEADEALLAQLGLVAPRARTAEATP